RAPRGQDVGLRSRAGVRVAYPGLAGDELDVRRQLGERVEIDDGLRRDHPVVGGEEQGAVAGEVGRQVRDERVHLAQRLAPLRGAGPVDVADDVEVGEVRVDETPP